MRRYALAALLGAVVIGGAPAAWAQSAPPPPASASAPRTPGDPWEHLNRFNYAIGGALDRHLIHPLTLFFEAITPGPIGRGVHNVLVNLSEPSVFINDVLQLRLKKAGVTAGRFVTNSTVGLLGLIDVADKLGLPHHGNAFGVTLGRYGVYAGPYIYLPVGGPTTVRDLIGAGVDILIDPMHLARFARQAEISATRFVVGGLDAREGAEAQLNALLSDATDPYATLRSVYLQNKQGEIDGGTTPLDLPSFDTPTPAPPQPSAANLFPDASSAIQPDETQRAIDDAAALKLMSQPYGLASNDLDRAAELGRTLGGVRSLEKVLAAAPSSAAGPSETSDPAPTQGLDLALASLK